MRSLLILFTLIISSYAYPRSSYSDDPFFTDDASKVTIVDVPYRHLFRQKAFEDEINRIEDAVIADNGKTTLMTFEVKENQGYFVARYFKRMLYDAYYDEGKVMIYTKRHIPFN